MARVAEKRCDREEAASDWFTDIGLPRGRHADTRAVVAEGVELPFERGCRNRCGAIFAAAAQQQ